MARTATRIHEACGTKGSARTAQHSTAQHNAAHTGTLKCARRPSVVQRGVHAAAVTARRSTARGLWQPWCAPYGLDDPVGGDTGSLAAWQLHVSVRYNANRCALCVCVCVSMTVPLCACTASVRNGRQRQAARPHILADTACWPSAACPHHPALMRPAKACSVACTRGAAPHAHTAALYAGVCAAMEQMHLRNTFDSLVAPAHIPEVEAAAGAVAEDHDAHAVRDGVT